MPCRVRLLFLGFVLGLVACGPPAAPGPPNLVLIVLDTFRSDRPGYAGGPAGLTPHLDALSVESTIFENAASPVATTFPAHASIFTGLGPRKHGVRWNGDALAPEFATMTELLRDAGYETAAFVSHRSLLERGGFAQGFDTASDRPRPGRPGADWSSTEITEMAERWLGAPRERPFFLWVHYFETHSPYTVTPYVTERLGDYEGLLSQGAAARQILDARDEILASEEHLRVLRDLYDASVLEADRHVGRLLAKLRETGRLEDTIVVVTADHGQALGENQALLHGGLIWDVALRVPLLIRKPGGCAGCRVRDRVSLIDLGPSLLDFAGVAAPALIDGRSLAPATVGDDLEPTVHFAETRGNPGRPDSSDDVVAVYIGRHKAIRGPRLFLFDLEADPGERSPLRLEDHRELAQQANRLADEYRKRGTERASTAREDLAPEVLEQLRSLGYLE